MLFANFQKSVKLSDQKIVIEIINTWKMIELKLFALIYWTIVKKKKNREKNM